MDNQNLSGANQPNPRRRKKSKLQIFKETLLPLIIAGIALVFILVFVIGSIVRGVQKNLYEKEQLQKASEESAALLAAQTQEAESIIHQANLLCAEYDYIGAVALMEGFSGNIENFPTLKALYTQCLEEKNTLVKWTDTNNILNLSFQMLIADPQRAFQDEKYGGAYNKNFVTTEEFTKILHQLYENDYVLIKLSDVYKDGAVQELYLPAGKKPLILTQTQVNYNTYMIDGDGDKLPDKDGDGFASKLIIDANGNITCEMVDQTGQVQTGAFDLVPILNSFVTTHPDFSYKGARAVLALTGYDGLFGYRTNPQAEATFGADNYGNEITAAKRLADALREEGYELACYTYNNAAYGQMDSAQIQHDLTLWNNEVSPILGHIDTLVFAKESDISESTAPYAGDNFDVLQSFGFVKYLGFCNEGEFWGTEGEGYIRLGRLLVTGSAMKSHSDWFDGIFDTYSVLDSTRP